MGMTSAIRRNQKEGFTFMELVIVIAILGILAVVVIPNAMTYLSEAKEETSRTNLGSLKTAIDSFMRKANKPPQTLKDLVRKPADLTARQWKKYLEGDTVPNDGFGNPFVYKLVPDGHPPYQLYSWGENGPGSPEDEWIFTQ